MEPITKNFIDQKLSEPDRESRYGFHFIQLFNANKLEFLLRYIRGWTPATTSPALLFGGTIHTAREFWYKHGLNEKLDLQELLDVFMHIHKSKYPLYAEGSKFQEDQTRGLLMLSEWGKATLNELDRYEFLSIEETWDVKLANGFPMTVKLDDLRRDRTTGMVLIGEAKTTSWSIDQMAKSVYEKDQRTHYSLGVYKARPDLGIPAVMPDIMYSRGSQAKVGRPAIFQSTPEDLLLYEQELIGLYMDLYVRIQNLRDGIPLTLLFPRNGDMTSLFGSVYSQIPRKLAYLSPLDQEPPEGFVVDPRVQSGLIQDFVDEWNKTGRIPEIEQRRNHIK